MRFIYMCLLFLSTEIISGQAIDFALPDSLSGWNSKGTLTFSFSNVGLSNWAGGGQDALSLSSDFLYEFQYAKEKIIWDSELNMTYGITRIEGFKGFRKTDDQLTLRTLYGRKLSKKAYLTSLTEFWTQMSNGFEYDDSNDQSKRLVSRVLAPGYISSNLGLTVKKQSHYAITLSPFTSKFTLVLDDSLANVGAFGVTPGKKIRFEGGASINGNYTLEIMKNITFKVSADFFSNYRDPSTVDINLRSSINMKVNEFITSRFSITMIYDEDVDIQRDDGTVGPALQIRNTINIGFYLNL